jgi:hypothetical protein
MNVENKYSYWVLEGKGLLEKLRCWWEDNIKFDLKSYRMGWYGVD